MKSIYIILILLTLYLANTTHAEVTITTWNAKEIFSENSVTKRKNDLKKLYSDIAPDVLLIQEITSCTQLQEIVRIVKKSGQKFYIACSDFNPNDNDRYSSFEVGVISRNPLSDILEFDGSIDGSPNGNGQEMELSPLASLKLPQTNVYRGFLSAKIEDLGVVVNVVHLKSSRGKKGARDKRNAEKREFVIGSIMSHYLDYSVSQPEYAFLVAGDFNVGHSDKFKNGVDLEVDCYEDCDDTDLYDETHAMLEGEIASGIAMRNLTYHHKKSTFPRYPGSPIDNIYVSGHNQHRFSAAIVHKKTYGSDHLPVSTILASNEKSERIDDRALTGEIDIKSLKGRELRTYLKNKYFTDKHSSLGYKTARRLMYSNIDKQSDGRVYGVYSGFSQAAKKTTFLNPINAEHTVPQSWFSKKEPMKSDIHHLFPTHKDPNNKRGSHPFGNISSPELWFGVTASNQLIMENKAPSENSDLYGEFKRGVFEPPESQKGNTARAIAYFYTMYWDKVPPIEKIFTGGNIDILLEWHNLDPVDQNERLRNKKIEEAQGNTNPYIDDASLLCRAWNFPDC